MAKQENSLNSTLAERLAELLGSSAITTRPRDRDFYSADALDNIRAFSAAPLLDTLPDVVVSPQTTQQVALVVDLANKESVSIVPYGAGTGVMGAAVPVRGGIVLSLAKMNRVLKISDEDLTAVTQPGVILGDLNRELEEHGLMLGHDPWSVPIASIGGAIGTNGVGYRAGKYGSMGQQVVSLEVVLPNGSIIRTRPVSKVAGPSLKNLFIGAEGVFGIVTEVTLRVFKQPEERQFRSFTFPSFESGFAAVHRLTQLDIKPSLMDLSEEWGPRVDPTNDEAHEISLILVSEGYTEGVEAEIGRALQVCEGAGGKDQGDYYARQHWEFRHQMAYRYQERLQGQSGKQRRARGWGHMMDYLHVSLPASQVLDFYRWSKNLIAKRGLNLYEASIWTNFELFSLLLGDPTPSGSDSNLAQTVDEILTNAQDLGGSMEYCHGVGVKLLHLMAQEWGTSVEMIQALKSALDPAAVMNPGKLGI